MIDFVLNKELCNLNKEFGFSKMVFVSVIRVDSGNDLRKKISGKSSLVAVGANKKTLREIFESKEIDLVLGLENIEEKDSLHYRNSGLNQVLCNLAKKNKISVGFSFSDILNSKEKGKLMGRMIQNIKLCKKYKVNMVFGSFAQGKYDLRTRKDLESFGRLLGITKLDNAKIFKLKEFNEIKVINE